MFPGGNSGMIRLIVRTLIPDAIEGPRTMEAVWKNPVNFAALDRKDQPVRIRQNSTAVRVSTTANRASPNMCWLLIRNRVRRIV